MKHEYAISGMTCPTCADTVHKLLARVPGVTAVSVTHSPPIAVIEMSSHIPLSVFRDALKSHPQYSITEAAVHHLSANELDAEEQKSFWQTYKPVLLVFAFITGVTIIAAWNTSGINVHTWMRYFMAGFFLVFSFFKMLDLSGFAESYMSYDVIAKRWFAWGYIYAFIELTLGLLFLLNVAPLLTNVATLLVMSISSIGVIQSLLANRRIRCACLGAVFNLPMSTITLIEDALMIAMSGATIVSHLL